MSGYLLKFKQTYSVKIGGRRYPVVKIGNQLWMAENLDWKFAGCIYRDGTSGNTIVDSDDAQSAYYNYDEATYGVNGNKYGLLYNWFASSYFEQHSSELGVPAGWHIPSKVEMNTLVAACGENPGTKLKSTSGWNDEGSGTDDYGFSCTPAGNISRQGAFSGLGSSAFILSSSASGQTVTSMVLSNNSTSASTPGINKHNYMSIRLVKSLT